MVKAQSQVMVAGPAVVARALGKTLDKESLGGWKIHESSGVVDLVVDSEADAFMAIQQFCPTCRKMCTGRFEAIVLIQPKEPMNRCRVLCRETLESHSRCETF